MKRRSHPLGARLLVSVTIVAAVSAPGATAHAGTIKVTTTADQYIVGAKCSLREAVQAAAGDSAFGGCKAGSGNDVIQLEGGRKYRLTRPGADPPVLGSGSIPLFGDVAVEAGGGKLATVDARGAESGAFSVTGTQNKLKRLLVKGGRDDIAGGGAAVIGGGGELSIDRSLLRGNRSTSPGGAIANFGELTVRRSTIQGSRSNFDGGAIYSSPIDTQVTIGDSTLTGNRAEGTTSGGGAIAAGEILIENSTISGNQADDNGGGLLAQSGLARLRNTTVTDNLADADAANQGSGGGIALAGGSAAVVNSILGGNRDSGGQADDCFGSSVSLGWSLLGDDSGCSGFFPTPDILIGVAPKLKGLAANGGRTKTHALKKASPARNAGNPAAPGSSATACLAKDQRGVRRPQGPVCDMGSFERLAGRKREEPRRFLRGR